MLYECDVKMCKKGVDHHVKVGPLDVGTCNSCHEAVFELGRQFNDEYNNMSRKYFKLVLDLKTEDKNVTTNPRSYSKPQNSEGD